MARNVVRAICIVALLSASLSAQINVVEDGFESYNDNFEFTLDWEPVPFSAVDAGTLTTSEEMFPGIEGQAIAHSGGGVNQWFPIPSFDPLEGDEVLEPTDEHSIQFGGDLFISTSNTRLSIGLRSNAPANILEIGAWNSDFRTLAYRLVLFDEGDVNWQFFELPIEFDANEDGVVTPGDFGPAWHHFQATVTPTDVTFELDVFRDGTVDATSVVEATPHSAMFDSFRIGGPSGVTSTGEGAFDNVFLRLVEPMTGGEGISGDYNNNGRVEQADLDLVLLNWGASFDALPADWTNERPTGGIIDQAELDGVLLNWGNTSAAGAVSAVPEPMTWLLAVLLMALAACRSLCWLDGSHGFCLRRGHVRSHKV